MFRKGQSQEKEDGRRIGNILNGVYVYDFLSFQVSGFKPFLTGQGRSDRRALEIQF